MTRPIYEPSTQRQIRGQGFTGDQLLRRPAPNTGAAAVQCYGWMHWANGTVAIPSGAWTHFNSIDDQPWATGWVSTENFYNVFPNLDDGYIKWTNIGGDQPLVLIHAWALISDNTWATGDVLGVAVHLGGSSAFGGNLRWIDTNTVGSVTTFMEDQYLSVSMFTHSEFGDNFARVEVFQSSSGDKSFADCGITAYVAETGDGDFV